MPKKLVRAVIHRGESLTRLLIEKASNAPDEMIQFVESFDDYEAYLGQDNLLGQLYQKAQAAKARTPGL